MRRAVPEDADAIQALCAHMYDNDMETEATRSDSLRLSREKQSQSSHIIECCDVVDTM